MGCTQWSLWWATGEVIGEGLVYRHSRENVNDRQHARACVMASKARGLGDRPQLRAFVMENDQGSR